MDNPTASQSILETLRTVEFRLGLKGYNVDEVDEYLEKAAVESETLLEQLRQTSERLRQATDHIAQLEGEGPRETRAVASEESGGDEALQRTLILAQKFVDQTKRDSEAEAALILSRAGEQAQALVAQAEDRAKKFQAEQEDKVRDEVSRLESVRAHLASDVENMARHLEAERNRLHGALSEMVKWVEDNVQPAKSLMGLRPSTVEPAKTPLSGAGSVRETAEQPVRAGAGARSMGGNGAELPGDRDEATQAFDLRSVTGGNGGSERSS